MASQPKWLVWARKLQWISQNGITYSRDPYDVERFRALGGLAAEIIAAHTDIDEAIIGDAFAREVGPSTPKLDVRAAVFRRDDILMVREREDGAWTLPGGWCDVGESPSCAAVREVKEESGYDARAVKLIAVFDKNCHDHPPGLFHTYKLIFLCELVGGEARDSIETSAAGFFAEDALPPLSEQRITRGQLGCAFAHHRDRTLPADFD
ncbi:MAG: NUDIX hydrolase [Proteobacteria bacterium]|nr:NUDIX hydrolase [Pseudomonadota bacterium]